MSGDPEAYKVFYACVEISVRSFLQMDSLALCEPPCFCRKHMDSPINQNVPDSGGQ